MSWMSRFIAINCSTSSINSNKSHPTVYSDETLFCETVESLNTMPGDWELGNSSGTDAAGFNLSLVAAGWNTVFFWHTEAGSFAEQFENSRGKTTPQWRNPTAREAAFFHLCSWNWFSVFFFFLLMVSHLRKHSSLSFKEKKYFIVALLLFVCF